MQTKNFLFMSIVLVLAVATITSLIGVKVFQNEVLLAPFGTGEEGQLRTDDISSDPNLIMIDDSIEMIPGTPASAAVSDQVDFGAVAGGSSYTTDIAAAGGLPRPFLLRNEGNVDVEFDALFNGGNLFDYSGSHVYLWVEDANSADNTGVDGWGAVDDCTTEGGCLNPDVGDCTANTQSGCDVQAAQIDVADSLNFEDCKDEVYLHVGIDVDNSESGAHTATLQISGAESLNPDATTC